MGMVLTYEFITRLVLDYQKDFCLYDDYNWDYTLMHISTEVSQESCLRIRQYSNLS